MLVPKKEIVKRCAGNPILTGKDVPAAARGVYNSGVTKYNGKYVMAARVETPDIKDYIWMAESDDGYKFKFRLEPVKMPDTDEFREYTEAACPGGMYYDPRITKLGDDYYVIFACHTPAHGSRIGQMRTRDFETFEWLGFGSEPDNRDSALFPEKINGMFCRLDRPGGPNSVWISYSPDMRFWGESKCVLRPFGNWAWLKVGPGAPPMKTSEGWLEIFHGVNEMISNAAYHLGVMLLDLEDPSKVIACGKCPILSPEELYECVGLCNNVVYSAGAVLEDGGEVKIYYGGADTVQCVATARLEDLVDAAKNR